MAQNPRRYRSLTGAWLPGRAQLNVGEASSAMMGELAGGQLRDDACCR